MAENSSDDEFVLSFPKKGRAIEKNEDIILKCSICHEFLTSKTQDNNGTILYTLKKIQNKNYNWVSNFICVKCLSQSGDKKNSLTIQGKLVCSVCGKILNKIKSSQTREISELYNGFLFKIVVCSDGCVENFRKNISIAGHQCWGCGIKEFALGEAVKAVKNRTLISPDQIPGMLEIIQFCSSCHYAGYCSVNCQRSDWKIHKKYCKKLQKLPILLKHLAIFGPKVCHDIFDFIISDTA